MPGLSHAHSEPAFAAAHCGSLVVLVWRDGASLRHHELARDLQRTAAGTGDGTCTVLHVHAGRRFVAPGEADRDRSADLIDEIGPGLVAQAHVVAGPGSRASAIRSHVVDVASRTRTRVATETFTDIGDALRWLAAHPDSHPTLARDRDALVDEIRRWVAGPVTPA